MHNDHPGRFRRTILLAPAATMLGLGGMTLVTSGIAAAPAASPVIQMVPNQSLGQVGRPAGPAPHQRGRASSSAATATAPCWASSNWSGYALSESALSGLSCLPASNTAYTAVTGTWTVPAVQATRRVNAYSAAWTGIDGFSNADLIQAGTEQDDLNGTVHYSAWWEILPAPETVIPSINVQPGDSITVAIAKISSTQWTITLTDNGHAGHAAQPAFTTTQSYSGPGTSAEWVLEAPEVNGQIATLAQYGSTTFDLSTVNGVSPALVAGTDGEMVQRAGRGQQVVSIPSAPDTGTPPGDGFAVAYGSTAPAAPTS